MLKRFIAFQFDPDEHTGGWNHVLFVGIEMDGSIGVRSWDTQEEAVKEVEKNTSFSCHQVVDLHTGQIVFESGP